MNFEKLGLNAKLLQAIDECGFEEPTAVQNEAIPSILAKRDILAAAQTGSGKTAAFALPLLQRLLEENRSQAKWHAPQVLILVPTRELALQVASSFELFAKYLDISVVTIVGGVSINQQLRNLKQGQDVLVATPGRLLDHLTQAHIRLDHVKAVVLDEADRMLDMGFINDIRSIMQKTSKDRQTLMFSATFSKSVRQLALQFQQHPVQVQVSLENTASPDIKQLIYPIKREYKRELLTYLIGHGRWRQVLIFVRTKHGADRLCKQLIQDGIKAAAIHGDKSQSARIKALEALKSGDIVALVATDIAARGLDIEQLPHVVNFDMPSQPEDYVHRIGRTGRAGATGEAISLVCGEEAPQLVAIEKLMQIKIPRVKDTGYETEPLDVPEFRSNNGKTASQKQPASEQRGKRKRSPASRAPGSAHGKKPNSGAPSRFQGKPKKK